jgi:hypothetical protein
MRYNGLIRVVSEQRRYNRAAHGGKVHYVYGPAYEGTGTCTDVGLGGVGVRLGRYLRPGTLVLVRMAGRPGDEPLQMKARVAWCRGTGGHHFAAGFQVFQEDPVTMQGLAQLTAWANLQANGDGRLIAAPTPKVVLGVGI